MIYCEFIYYIFLFNKNIIYTFKFIYYLYYYFLLFVFFKFFSNTAIYSSFILVFLFIIILVCHWSNIFCFPLVRSSFISSLVLFFYIFSLYFHFCLVQYFLSLLYICIKPLFFSTFRYLTKLFLFILLLFSFKTFYFI